jgi:hypothetical protein
LKKLKIVNEVKKSTQKGKIKVFKLKLKPGLKLGKLRLKIAGCSQSWV